MNEKLLDNFIQKTINFFFIFLFLIIPLFFTPVNSELFEFNKIILLYSFTVIITTLWAGRWIINKKPIFHKTPLDLPILLFLLSQVLATIFSIDPHTSLFGYYSRFNGGLISIICYLILYWAFVSNCDQNTVKKIVNVSLFTGLTISVYGILEHFGYSFSCLMFFGKFDVSCWIQKVQERVFATLGQPNWLAAYLDILIPIIIASSLKNLVSRKNKKFFLNTIFYLFFFSCLLSTKSRSGFLAWATSFAFFYLIIFIARNYPFKKILFSLISFSLVSLLLIYFLGSPVSQLDKFLRFNHPKNTSPPNSQTQIEPSEDGGISESGDIRKIVWKGALDIFKNHPLLGTGVETFAYSYYNFRPMEHNLLSEWDFLYNKAHNEYLNYLSTTGLLGTGTYLFYIIFFSLWFLINQIKNKTPPQSKQIFKKIASPQNEDLYLTKTALFSGWLSILLTNFFGFSVVIVSLYFYLIPAFIFVLSIAYQPNFQVPSTKPNITTKILLGITFVIFVFLETKIINYWRADYFYAKSQKAVRLNDYQNAYLHLYKAQNLFKNEPVYLADLSYITAILANMSVQENQPATQELIDLATRYSNQSIQISPRNLNILKTRVKTFYALSLIKPEYLTQVFETLEQAIKLAPTDPKLIYNKGLLYLRQKEFSKAQEILEKSLEMKPNYVDAKNILVTVYEETGQIEKAKEQLKTLIKLAPENAEQFQKKLEELEKK